MNWKTAVSQVERVATAKGRRQTGQYAIEGLRLLERAYRAGVPIQFVLVSEAMVKETTERLTRILNALSNTSTEILPIPASVMTDLTNGRSLGGVIGMISMPTPVVLGDLLEGREHPLLLTAVNVIDPGNCGAMIRTAHASGCNAFIALGQTDPYHPKAVRTSMGSLFKLPIVHYEAVESIFADLDSLGILKVGTAVEGGRLLTQVTFPKQGIALFMGNEYHGLPSTLQGKFDLNVSIPMPEGVDSFSINAATAVLLYEINRQREM